MSTPREVEGVARRVNSSINEVKRKQDNFMREVINIGGWWEGEASKAFKEECGDINAEINRLVSNMKSLESKLRALANQMRRADEERRRQIQRDSIKKP